MYNVTISHIEHEESVNVEVYTIRRVERLVEVVSGCGEGVQLGALIGTIKEYGPAEVESRGHRFRIARNKG